MPTAIVTGSGGLIGSESVQHFVEAGYDVIGLENDMRAHFFGPSASTAPTTERLQRTLGDSFQPAELDIRDADGVDRVFAEHAALAGARDPHRGPAVPRLGGIRAADRLHGQRQRHAQPARGDPPPRPRRDASSSARPTRSTATCPITCRWSSYDERLELPEDHRYFRGIDTSMSIDASTHSLFGVSKAAADLLVQEYGRYFDMPTVCFRGGCLTGPNHAGAKLHGFLSYLMRCTMTGDAYTVFGYGGKQVRDNIHSADLVAAFEAFHRAPRAAAVYNIGGGRASNCSMLEAIEHVRADRRPRARAGSSRSENRIGDHRWWISDLEPFRRRLPGLGHHLRHRGRPARDPRAERGAVARRRR